MRKSDGVFLCSTLGGMGLGMWLPAVGEYVPFLPTVAQLVLLLICFLIISHPGSSLDGGVFRQLRVLIPVKLVLAPLFLWAVFALVLPKYTLGAVLLGGASVGVAAPVLMAQVRGNFQLVMGGVIGSSLLMPLTLPLFVTGVLFSQGGTTGAELWQAFAQSGISLALFMFIPFVLAKLLWRFQAPLAEAMIAKAFSLSIICLSCSMLVIFSRYSGPLRANPHLLPEGLAVAFFVAVLLLLFGGAVSWRQPLDTQMAYIVSMSGMNCVLMTILSSQFFGIEEIILTAMFSVPFTMLLIPYRWFRRWREQHPGPAPGEKYL